MGTITTEQNSEKQLERLAAQRQIYSDAKWVQAAQVFLAVPVAIGLGACALLWPQLKVYAAFYGITLTAIDLTLLTPYVKALQKQAANIQELFDCNVLRMEWPDLLAGRRPDPETVVHYARKYIKRNGDYKELENWYPTAVGELPLELGRLICQRTNCWWDMAQRRRYAGAMLVFAISLLVLLFVIGLAGQFTLEDAVLRLVAPFLPVFVLSLRHHREHLEAATNLERLKDAIERTWHKAVQGLINSSDLDCGERRLQDQIYDSRRRNPVMFEWVYARLKRDSEEEMHRGADDFLRQYQEALSQAGFRSHPPEG